MSLPKMTQAIFALPCLKRLGGGALWLTGNGLLSWEDRPSQTNAGPWISRSLALDQELF